MRSTEGRIPPGQEQLRKEVGGFADRVTSVVDELREMSRGIHPAVLSKGGLSPALEALALRSAVPVKLNVRHEQRPPDAVEVAAYYVASEALTNVAKHPDASRVRSISISTTRGSAFRCATEWAAPTRVGDPASSTSRIASRRSAGRSRSKVHKEEERDSKSRS
jgi:hypothetical protein